MRLAPWGTLGISLSIALVACGVDTSGTAAAEDASTDATDAGLPDTQDATSNDGEPDANCPVKCGDACVNSCAECPDHPISCGDTCVASCSDCAGNMMLCVVDYTCAPDCNACPERPVACVDCAGAGGSPRGICQASPRSCPLTGLCPCTNNDPGSCPLPSHVCITTGSDPVGACTTCGQTNTDGRICKGGNACDEAASSCTQ